MKRAYFRTTKRTLAALVLATLSATATSFFSVANAQTGPVSPAYKIPDGSKEKDGPIGIKLDDNAALFPYMNFSFGRDNNLFLTDTNRRSSNIQIYNPGIKLEVASQQARFGLSYDLNIGRYSQSSADNYTDHKVLGTAEFVFSSSMGLKLAAEYVQGHDARGSTDRGISGVPDEYRTTNPSMLFAYGANDAKGRVEVYAGTVDKRYQNNRSSTVGSDRNTDSAGGRFFFRVAPKTALLIEAREDRFDYKLSTSAQDSKERRYLVGVTWDATAATNGTIKIGQIRKDFAVASLKDYSSTGWEANMTWKPTSYSKFDFFTTKGFSESTGLGDFTLAKKYGARWEHAWNSRLKSTASLSRGDDDFIGNTRVDTTDSLGLKLNYKVMRWLTIGGEYTNTSRDSNTSGSNYKKNLYMLTLGATL